MPVVLPYRMLPYLWERGHGPLEQAFGHMPLFPTVHWYHRGKAPIAGAFFNGMECSTLSASPLKNGTRRLDLNSFAFFYIAKKLVFSFYSILYASPDGLGWYRRIVFNHYII